MVKGFFTKDDKVHPINEKTKRVVGSSEESHGSSDDDLEDFANSQKLDFENDRFLAKRIWKFDDAPDDVKEKILEKNYDINVNDTFWTEFDGLIYDKESQIADYDVFENYHKIYFDIDRGQYLQFADLKVKNDEKLREMLGVPKKVWDKAYVSFVNPTRDGNTKIEFEPDDPYDGKFTENDEKILEKAKEKWSDLVHDAWVNLRDTYEDLVSDKQVAETLRANEYDFDENGNIV